MIWIHSRESEIEKACVKNYAYLKYIILSVFTGLKEILCVCVHMCTFYTLYYEVRTS